MVYRNNQKGVLDARQIEYIVTDPYTGLLDSKSSSTMSKSGIGSLPIQNTLTDLTTNYPASSYPGDSAIVGNTVPYKLYISNGISWMPISQYLDATTPGALEDRLDAISAGTSPDTIYLLPGATYTLIRNPTLDLYKTSLVGSDNIIDASNVTIGLTIDYKSAYTNGAEIRNGKSRKITGFRLKGPGKTATGTVGMWFNGSVASNSPNASLKNICVHDFETLLGGRDRFYLVDTDGCEFYNGTYGIWQQAGNDSGEGCVVTGGVFDQCYCFIRVDDPSSEWTFNGVSFDYGRQLLVATNLANIQFNNCHIECRGANLASDNLNYVVSGTGSDTRAPFQGITPNVNGAKFVLPIFSTQTNVAMTLNVGGTGAYSILSPSLGNPSVVSGIPIEVAFSTSSNAYVIQSTRTMGNIPCATNTAGTTTLTCDAIVTRDVFIDVDGDGTTVRFNSGNLNINNSGGNGPYAWYRLVKVRNIGSFVEFTRMVKGNDLNVADHFWDGPGRVIPGFISKVGGDPICVKSHNHLARYNAVPSSDLTYSAVNPANGTAITNNVTTANLGNYQNWWIYMGRGGNAPTARLTDTSNGAYGTVSFTATISGTTMTVSAISSGSLYPNMTFTGSGVTTAKIVSQSSGTTGSTGNYVIDTSQTVGTGTAMTASYPTGNVAISVVQPSVGNATTTSWSISGEVITINATVTNVFIRDMTLSGTGVATGTKIIGQLTGTTGGAGTYLIDTVHGTVAGSGTLTGSITNAIQFTKYNAETSGYLSRARVALAVPIQPGKTAVAKILTMIPSSGGVTSGTVTLTSQYIRLSPQLDSNGCPVMLDIPATFPQVRFKSFTVSSTTKDVWNESILDAWSGGAEAPVGATHYAIYVQFDSVNPGVFYHALPRVDIR